MPECFVKIPSADHPSGEAQGPFSIEILKTLAESGKINPETLCFYDDNVGWQPIKANETIYGQIFGSKNKLKLKNNLQTETKKSEKATESALTVEEMLQSAQGKTAATKHQTFQKRWQDRVAALSLPFLTILHLLMGILILLSHADVLTKISQTGDWKQIVFIPGLILGGVILLIGVLLLLSLVAVYPAVRYIGLLFLGYMGVQAWSYLYEGLSQGWMILGAGLGFGLGVYAMTLTLNFPLFIFATLCAGGGILSYGYFLCLAT